MARGILPEERAQQSYFTTRRGPNPPEMPLEPLERWRNLDVIQEAGASVQSRIGGCGPLADNIGSSTAGLGSGGEDRRESGNKRDPPRSALPGKVEIGR